MVRQEEPDPWLDSAASAPVGTLGVALSFGALGVMVLGVIALVVLGT
jgi:hypothetical protein